MDKKVLLLNASEEVLQVIDWKKAIKLLIKGKAKRPFDYKTTYEIPTTSGNYTLPAAIVLVEYVYVPHAYEKTPTRKNIFNRDNWTCQYCGMKSKDTKKLTIDHVYPRCKGGGWQWTNLTTACASCNSKKANMTPKECGMYPKNKPVKPCCKQTILRMIAVDEYGEILWERWTKSEKKSGL